MGGVGRVGRMGRVGGWGGWALHLVGRALHMLCKVSLLLLLLLHLPRHFRKLKRASRSLAKTGFFDGSKSMAGAMF